MKVIVFTKFMELVEQQFGQSVFHNLYRTLPSNSSL